MGRVATPSLMLFALSPPPPKKTTLHHSDLSSPVNLGGGGEKCLGGVSISKWKVNMKLIFSLAREDLLGLLCVTDMNSRSKRCRLQKTFADYHKNLKGDLREIKRDAVLLQNL